MIIITNLREIGNKLLAIRKHAGLTQNEVAEKAELSDRTYADIERGTANMRLETLLKICKALKITPNEILTDNISFSDHITDMLNLLERCDFHERETALQLLHVYLSSLTL